METQKNDNLSKGDVISFVALILLGVVVFFGLNFKSLGDKVLSLIVAVLLFVLMTVFVFLAAHAKSQNRNQSMWKGVEYAMVVLYIIALIPCYIYTSKFFEIYFDKTSISQQVQSDIEDLNKMFEEYNRDCDSRCSSFSITLDALYKDTKGREQIASLLNVDVSEVTSQSTQLAVESFSNALKGGSYQIIVSEKNKLVDNLQNNIKNWNILFLPQYAAELGDAKVKYAKDLEEIYNDLTNDLEQDIPSFNAQDYATMNSLKDTFSGNSGFSIIGLIAIIFLGGLGLVKYLLGESRTVIPFKEGDASSITEDGGFTIG